MVMFSSYEKKARMPVTLAAVLGAGALVACEVPEERFAFSDGAAAGRTLAQSGDCHSYGWPAYDADAEDLKRQGRSPRYIARFVQGRDEECLHGLTVLRIQKTQSDAFIARRGKKETRLFLSLPELKPDLARQSENR